MLAADTIEAGLAIGSPMSFSSASFRSAHTERTLTATLAVVGAVSGCASAALGVQNIKCFQGSDGGRFHFFFVVVNCLMKS